VVLSGGEPTMQVSAPDAAAAVRTLGYTVKLDTNGLLPGAIRHIAPDYLALDIKTCPSRYPVVLGATLTGVSERLRESIAIAKSMGEKAEVRITLASGIIDAEAIGAIAAMVAGVRRVFLQPMRVEHGVLDPSMAETSPLPADIVEEYRRRVGAVVGECWVRGLGRRA